MEAESPKLHSIRESADPRSVQWKRDLDLMKDYLSLCIRKEDWHGVMDAAADIREIVAKLSVLA